MTSIKNVALSALLTIGAFMAVTYTACNKDECKDVVCVNGGVCSGGTCTGCDLGYTGSRCETELRTTYVGTYKGNGSDNAGGSYTNWGLIFAANGTDATSMGLTLVDANSAPQLTFTVTLTSSTGFSVDPKTSGNFSYTGTGTINGTTATLTLTETETGGGTSVVVYTFNNMNK